MINLKKIALASLFVASGAFAQEGGLKGLLTDDASVGVSVGALTYVSSDSDVEFGYGLNYTKQINAVVTVQGAYLSGGLSSSKDSMNFTAL